MPNANDAAAEQQARTLTYLNRVNEALAQPGHNIKTTTSCPECDQEIGTMGVETLAHWIMRDADSGELVVVVGCEGYWVVDPGAVGIEDPNWGGTPGVNI